MNIKDITVLLLLVYSLGILIVGELNNTAISEESLTLILIAVVLAAVNAIVNLVKLLK